MFTGKEHTETFCSFFFFLKSWILFVVVVQTPLLTLHVRKGSGGVQKKCGILITGNEKGQIYSNTHHHCLKFYETQISTTRAWSRTLWVSKNPTDPESWHGVTMS